MTLSLKPRRMKRYTEIARMLIRHGRRDLATHLDLDEAILDEDREVAGGDPKQLARDLEQLGPTFVKLGQLLSTRADLLPPDYLDALSRLRDDVEPFATEDVEAIVSSELGVRVSKAFAAFESKPMAAASLAQVHRARLRDGRRVVVKVQRPDVRERVADDLDALAELAGVIDRHTDVGRRYGFCGIVDEFRRTLLQELDFRQEAQNLVTMREMLDAYESLVVPRPVLDFTTSRVLTMDYVEGTTITSLSSLVRAELDGTALADDLTRAYLDQILAHGTFHADPHPGNVVLTPDGRLALLDLGMVGRLDETMRTHLLKLVLAITDGRGRDVADLCIEMGTRLDDCDTDTFSREVAELVSRHEHLTLDQIDVGRIMIELTRVSASHGLRPARELSTLGRTLLHVDAVGRALHPGFDPRATVRRHAESLMRRHMLRGLSPARIFSSTLEMNELVQQLPGRVNTVLDNLANNRLEVKVQAFDESRLMHNLQKIANRIALGVVLAALIVGAAMLMRIETSFTILGYPGVAMLLFLLAAAGGFGLVISVLVSDFRRVS